MRNIKTMKTPLITRVVMLNRLLCERGRYIPHKKRVNGDNITVDIRRCYLYPLLGKAGILFNYSLRQLRGKDYLKRSLELIEEIQCQCYLIFELKGWSGKTCADVDIVCDTIIEQLYALDKSNKKKPESLSLNDENE